eukprot:CAMPEP_0198206158 /NCGR_PEP_ID=MMETSP1445-20131203/9691_1 /TAXON_ID=36898 /ORGANISM="Pyramimonas sp., Strain CCMP2087" /LENGTH=77 /DNA_ID=CAMNT_0043878737 /DNA_START=595 /DNA_END=828 /DNA_ORIENTATION=+
MGAVEGGHGLRPNVWTPSGGWYPDPKGWRGNLGKAYLALFVIGGTIAYTSAQLEHRPVKPAFPIPSMRWCNNFPKDE